MSNKRGEVGRRSQVEAERTRKRVLDRAERLFARKGYRGVSLREVAAASGVRPFTIQHHFGSKLGLYQAVFSRWDPEVLDRVTRMLGDATDLDSLVERVVDEVFELFLARRDWVALNARVMLGEGLPKGVKLSDQSWVRFIETAMRDRWSGPSHTDLGLMLITIEGVLHHHVLSAAHYRYLFGEDVTEPRLKAATKGHLKRVILAVLGTVLPADRERAPGSR